MPQTAGLSIGPGPCGDVSPTSNPGRTARKVPGIDRDRAILICVTLAGLVLFVARAILVGQDANWDLQNYHDYAAYALLHWRYGLDVGAAGLQGYFNPLPYVPSYLLRHHLPPLLAASVLAAAQSVVVPLLWILSGQLLRSSNAGLPFRAAATACGVWTAMTVSEIGTSFADLPLAAPVLGALCCVLASDRATDLGRSRARDRLLMLAGLLAGTATGLKLTNAILGIGLLIACLPPWPIGRATAGRALRFAGGGVVGILATAGPWAALMWIRYGDPVFPAYNTVFRSRSAAVRTFADASFLPHGPIDAATYPFRIAAGLHPTAENPFAEPRFAILMVLAVLWGVLLLGRLFRPAVRHDRAATSLALVRALIFTAAGFCLWLTTFAIERYEIVGEMMAGVLAIALLPRLLPAPLMTLAACALAVLTIGLTRPADWWHRGWADPFGVSLPDPLRRPAAYLLVVHPSGYWASALPGGSRFYSALSAVTGVGVGGVLAAQRRDGLAHPPGGLVRTLGDDIPMAEAARLGLDALGFVPAAPCLRLPSLWWVNTIVCRADRMAGRSRAASDLPLDTPVDFSWSGSGWIYLGQGWANGGPTGTAMDEAAAELILAQHPTGRPNLLELRFARPVPDAGLGILLNGRPIPAGAEPDQAATIRRICLAAAAVGGPVVTTSIRLHRPDPGAMPTPILSSMILRDPAPCADGD